jgi:TRAP-type C4-dicarboxylate transport system permease small subunit
MAVLERLERFNRRLSIYMEAVAAVGLLTMMVVTCVDVVGAKVFLHPLFGSIDIVELSQLVAISFTGASALILGNHVKVEFFMVMLPKRIAALGDSIIHFLGFLLFALVVWRLLAYGYSLQVAHEVSPTIRIPLYGFAYGFAVASVPLCLVLLSQMIQSLKVLIEGTNP